MALENLKRHILVSFVVRLAAAAGMVVKIVVYRMCIHERERVVLPSQWRTNRKARF